MRMFHLFPMFNFTVTINRRFLSRYFFHSIVKLIYTNVFGKMMNQSSEILLIKIDVPSGSAKRGQKVFLIFMEEQGGKIVIMNSFKFLIGRKLFYVLRNQRHIQKLGLPRGGRKILRIRFFNKINARLINRCEFAL